MSSAPELPTEQVLDVSASLHRLPPDEILALFEAQDRKLIDAVAAARRPIAELAAAMANALGAGGRVIYAGSGTSGRLGALDAAEWEPTFGIPRSRFQLLLAGGEAALSRAIEGAEDHRDDAREAFLATDPRPHDVVVGITASGTTPFVAECLDLARERDIPRAIITVNEEAHAEDPDLIRVVLATGPEVLAGSTRLKAAAATHLVLQRASNVCAVQLGWIHAGRMVEMRPTNAKLRRRAVAIVAALGGVDADAARELLDAAAGDIKVALLGARCGDAPDVARRRLEAVGRRLTEIEEYRRARTGLPSTTSSPKGDHPGSASCPEHLATASTLPTS